jgi:hypothetical protein
MEPESGWKIHPLVLTLRKINAARFTYSFLQNDTF